MSRTLSSDNKCKKREKNNDSRTRDDLNACMHLPSPRHQWNKSRSPGPRTHHHTRTPICPPVCPRRSLDQLLVGLFAVLCVSTLDRHRHLECINHLFRHQFHLCDKTASHDMSPVRGAATVVTFKQIGLSACSRKLLTHAQLHKNYPSIHPSIQPTIQPTNQPTNHPTNQPTIYPSIHPSYSIHLSIYPPMIPSIHPCIRPFIHPSIHPYIYHCICLSVSPSSLALDLALALSHTGTCAASKADSLQKKRGLMTQRERARTIWSLLSCKFS